MSVRRISIGPGEIAGYFSRLKTGFDELGIPCEHFVLTENKFAYHESGYFLKSPFLFALGLRDNDNKVLHWSGRLLSLCIRMAVFAYALVRCDVFILSGSYSFFRFRELPLLKLLGKKILVVYFGSDARPPLFSGRHLDDAGGYVEPSTAYLEAVALFNKIRRVEKYADIIVNHTATAQFFSRPFIRFAAVGLPVENARAHCQCDAGNFNQIDNIRILHAPSRPLAKGSPVFRQVIDELREEGYLIDFVELVGVPNAVVLKELERCDFVVDELYSDMPLAMLATEAAMFGKPVVVGGYYAEQYAVDNPDLEIPPSLYVSPEKVKDAIRKMIDDRGFRMELGERAKKFIQKYWNTKQVAQNYLRLIDADIPAHWVSEPANRPYYWGWGLSKENWRAQVSNYVSSLGEGALLLDQNLPLKNAVLDEMHKSG